MAVRPANPRLTGRLVVWAPVFLVMAVIFGASSLPGRNIPSLFPLQDVFFHGTIYAILAFFFKRALKKTYPHLTGLIPALVTVLFVCAYGASDEFHQLFVPGRSATVSDLLIDAAGGLLGAIFYR